MRLKVKAKGTAMVHNFEALDAGVLRFVGRKHDPTIGETVEVIENNLKRTIKTGGWAPTGEAEEVPDRHEYRHAVKAGDLEAADEATAKLCGVVFVAEVTQ